MYQWRKVALFAFFVLSYRTDSHNSGMKLHKAGRLAEAEAHYWSVVESHSTNGEIFNDIGVLALQQGRPLEAEAYFKQAVVLMPSLGPAHVNAGVSALSRNATDEAISALQKGVELGQSVSHSILGAVLRQKHANAEAAHHLRRALQNDLGDLTSLVHEEMNQIAQTEEAIGKLVHGESFSAPLADSEFSTPLNKTDMLESELIVFTVATRADEPGFRMLLHSAEKAGIKVWVRGSDAATLRYWGQGGFGIKLEILRDVLDHAVSNKSLILMIDAYDVLFSPAASVRSILERFESMGWPIVTAAESYCVSETCAGAGGKTNGDSHPLQPYLNSGIILGRAGALREILNSHSWDDPLDDQSWWGRVWHETQSGILADSARQIFACPSLALQVGKMTHAIRTGAIAELRLRRGRPVQAFHRNRTIASEPLLLHFPGVVRPLLKPAFEGLFSARAATTSTEMLPQDAPSWNTTAKDALRILPGSLLGAPLRQGPFQCTRQACWSETSACLCLESGSRLVVDQVYLVGLDASPTNFSQPLEKLQSAGLRAVYFPTVAEESASGRWHIYVRSHLRILQEVLARRWKFSLVLSGSLLMGSARMEELLLQLTELSQRDPLWHWAWTDGDGTSGQRILDLQSLLSSSIQHMPSAYFVSAEGASTLVPIFEDIAAQSIGNSFAFAQHLVERSASLLTYRLR